MRKEVEFESLVSLTLPMELLALSLKLLMTSFLCISQGFGEWV